MLKGLHAWVHDLLLPHISLKRSPIHSMVREAYYIQNDLGWDNLLRDRLHRSWESAQSAYQASREQAISRMMHGLIRLLWEAAEKMRKAHNQMEHGTTENARSKYVMERMNAQLDEAYKQKKLTSIAARIQLFKIFLERRKNYRLNTNKRWLDMVRAAVANKSRHNEKNGKCQYNIKTFLLARREKRTYENSSTAKPYFPWKYVKGNLTHLYVNPVRKNKTRASTNPQAQNVIHRKVKFARITAFFKIKDG